mmetsp:Transcript_33833/g.66789  ORF Transcript_33833/g.66789 Transcript_33833/m.66789 type:complete len:378 (-) Transcript_33833:183-1316(-)
MMRFPTLVSILLGTVLCFTFATTATSETQSHLRGRELKKILLPNGKECSENSQCENGCCVWNPFGDQVCGDDKWFNECNEGYTFVKGSMDTCGDSDGDNGLALRIMTYNLYLIFLAPDVKTLETRARRISHWFGRSPGNGYDVIVLQETWLLPDTIRYGMTNAGYCHYVYDNRGTFGSGLAVYSKFPIEEHDFRGFGNNCAVQDCAVDKGVIYVRINKNGRKVNIFGTHAISEVDNHDTRRLQYDVMRKFIDEQNIDSELVILAGDFNEDKINTPRKYKDMLKDLNAGEVPRAAKSPLYSYDPENNSVLDPDAPGADGVQRALDFIFYDKSKKTLSPAEGSVCRYLLPKDHHKHDLSDHYPAGCEITFDNLVLANTK